MINEFNYTMYMVYHQNFQKNSFSHFFGYYNSVVWQWFLLSVSYRFLAIILIIDGMGGEVLGAAL